MPESSKPARIVAGKVVGVFGIKGWLKVKAYTQPAENILAYAPWYVRLPNGSVSELVVDQHQFKPQGLIVHIEGVDDRSQAERIGKPEIEVDRSCLPELEEGDFYWHQLLGLNVISEFDGAECTLGRVASFLETGANDVLVVRGDRERLVPYVPGQFIKSVDIESGVIRVEWDPEF